MAAVKLHLSVAFRGVYSHLNGSVGPLVLSMTILFYKYFWKFSFSSYEPAVYLEDKSFSDYPHKSMDSN